MQSPVGPQGGVSGQVVSPAPASPAAVPPVSPTGNRPVVQALPEDAPARPVTPGAAGDSEAPAAARTSTAPRPAARTVPSGPAISQAPDADLADRAPVTAAPAAPVAAEPMPLPAASQPAVQDTAEDSETLVWAGALLSALALAGLAGVAGMAIRRRRKVHDVRSTMIERPVVDHNGMLLGTTVARPAVPLPAAVSPPPVTTAAFAPRPLTAMRGDLPAMASAGASVALPRERYATAAERRALIERLAAAKPDRANPFRSHKARLHRAKLIEQSIGRTFPGGRSRIDLSQYPLNWPELSSSRPAAA